MAAVEALDIEDDIAVASFRRSWLLSMKARSTIRNYVYSLDRVSSWLHENDRTLLTATRVDLEAFLMQRYEEVSVRTAQTDHKALRAFYKWAVKDRDVEVWKNPMVDISGPHVEPGEYVKPTITATDEDYQALLSTCRVKGLQSREARSLAIRDAAIIAVLWWTGMRRAEVSGLDVCDIDLEHGTINVRATTTKSRKARLVPILDQDLLVALDRWLRYRAAYRTGKQAGDALFVSFGRNGKIGRGRLQPGGITQMLERRSELAGVEVPAHSFRRGRAEQNDKHIDGIDSERMMGWTNDRMRKLYTRVNGDRDASDRIRAAYADPERPARFKDLGI